MRAHPCDPLSYGGFHEAIPDPCLPFISSRRDREPRERNVSRASLLHDKKQSKSYFLDKCAKTCAVIEFFFAELPCILPRV